MALATVFFTEPSTLESEFRMSMSDWSTATAALRSVSSLDMAAFALSMSPCSLAFCAARSAATFATSDWRAMTCGSTDTVLSSATDTP